jgi:hypothetical protein
MTTLEPSPAGDLRRRAAAPSASGKAEVSSEPGEGISVHRPGAVGFF